MAFRRFFLVWSSLFLVLAVLIVMHRPDMILIPQPWAEDAPVFLDQVRTMGKWSLFESYSGYYHFIPRVVFYISYKLSSWFGQGISLFPLFTNISAIIINSICVAFIVHPMFNWISTIRTRVVTAILIVMIPYSPEIFGSSTNLQWWFGYVIFLVSWHIVVTERFPSRLISVMMLLISLSTPMGIFFLLSSGYCVIKRVINDRKIAYIKEKAIDIILLSLGFLIQLTLIVQGRPIEQPPFKVEDAITSLINYIFAGLFARPIIPNLHDVVEVYSYSTVVCIGMIVCGYIYISYKDRKAVIVTAYVYLFILSMITFKGSSGFIMLFKNQLIDAGGRYIFVSIAIIITLLTSLIDNSSFRKSIVPCVIVALFFCNGITGFQFKPFHNYEWSKATQNFNANSEKICEVPINPDGWDYKYPCN